MSAEYVVAHGNPNVILCERGIRTFETATRNTCDIAAIAVLNELTHLPVILDPSHATGKRSLVPALARAGVAIGADGLIVEVHPAPEKAVSDGAQSLDIPQFHAMMRSLTPYIESVEGIASYRNRRGGISSSGAGAPSAPAASRVSAVGGVRARSGRRGLLVPVAKACRSFRFSRSTCRPPMRALFISMSDALRRSGILAMLAGSKTSEEPDYQQFVRQTKFDYRQDLDAVAAAFENGRTYFALRGRFHWNNLKDYATRQGGSCHNDFCVLAGSQPNRRISFYALKSNVLAMAIAPDDFAAYQVAVQPAKPALSPPSEPVWALIPSAALQSMDALPAAAKAYVPALQGADQIIFSIGADRSQQLQLGVHVTCKDATAASALLTAVRNHHESAEAIASRTNIKSLIRPI